MLSLAPSADGVIARVKRSGLGAERQLQKLLIESGPSPVAVKGRQTTLNGLVTCAAKRARRSARTGHLRWRR